MFAQEIDAPFGGLALSCRALPHCAHYGDPLSSRLGCSLSSTNLAVDCPQCHPHLRRFLCCSYCGAALIVGCCKCGIPGVVPATAAAVPHAAAATISFGCAGCAATTSYCLMMNLSMLDYVTAGKMQLFNYRKETHDYDDAKYQTICRYTGYALCTLY